MVLGGGARMWGEDREGSSVGRLLARTLNLLVFTALRPYLTSDLVLSLSFCSSEMRWGMGCCQRGWDPADVHGTLWFGKQCSESVVNMSS